MSQSNGCLQYRKLNFSLRQSNHLYMLINKKSSRSRKLNKKLIGIGVGIAIAIIILVSTQSYKTVPENILSQPNVQQLPNATLSKPLTTGKHITVELNESMHFAIK